MRAFFERLGARWGKNMKLRYFIPLFLLSALIIMLLYTALIGATVSWSFHFMKEEYGRGNLVITRLFAVLAGMVKDFMSSDLEEKHPVAHTSKAARPSTNNTELRFIFNPFKET